MSDEDNPFMIAPKPVQKRSETTISFGTDEEVSFMVSPGELKERETRTIDEPPKPHWERSGTPLWDKKNIDIDNPDYEVVDHDES
ncbi:MAG: hypothetical protein JW939_01205 [Candidatus Thermoplasmatota archaeon]|nr:hypothetical protein [Candidatus Thermoplasmatota archaeon]